MIAFIFPSLSPSPTFPLKCFRCPFLSKSAHRNRWPPPPTFLCFPRPCIYF
jgi:hypothetical protein